MLNRKSVVLMNWQGGVVDVVEDESTPLNVFFNSKIGGFLSIITGFPRKNSVVLANIKGGALRSKKCQTLKEKR